MSSISTSIRGKSDKHSMFSYGMLILALTSMVFLGVCNPQSYREGISGTAATVGDQEISNREFAWTYQNVSERLRSQYGEQFNASILRVAHIAMNQLVDDRILFLESEKYAFSATDKEVLKAIADFKEFKDEKTGKFSRDRFEKFLRAAQLSETVLLEDQRRAMSVARLKNYILSASFVSSKEIAIDNTLNKARANIDVLTFDTSKAKVEVSNKEIDEYLAAPDGEAKAKAWYDSHMSDYKSEEKVKASHVLIAYKGARSVTPSITRSKDEARTEAGRILAQVNGAGANFGELARKYSDEPGAKKSRGDLGFFTRTDMVPEFSTAAFSLKPGDISQIVESPFGFHIIKVEEKRPAIDISLADAKLDIVKKMLLEVKGPAEMEAKAKAILNAIIAKEDPKSLMNAMGVEWQNVKEFSPTARSIPGLGAKQNLIDAVLTLDAKEKPVYPDLIRVGATLYIAKLNSVTKDDKKDLDPAKLRDLSYSASLNQGYSDFSAFQQRSKKDYEERNAIHMNPQYLAVDDAQEQES